MRAETHDIVGGPLPIYDAALFSQSSKYTLEATLVLLSTQIAQTAQQQEAPGSSDRAMQRARRDLKELASDLVEEFLDKKVQVGQIEDKLLTLLKTFVMRL